VQDQVACVTSVAELCQHALYYCFIRIILLMCIAICLFLLL